jgi:hypothetical protein
MRRYGGQSESGSTSTCEGGDEEILGKQFMMRNRKPRMREALRERCARASSCACAAIVDGRKGTRRVQLVRRDGRDVSTLYGREGGGGVHALSLQRGQAGERDVRPLRTGSGKDGRPVCTRESDVRPVCTRESDVRPVCTRESDVRPVCTGGFVRAGRYQRALVVAARGGPRYKAVEEAAAPLAARKDRAVHLSGRGGLSERHVSRSMRQRETCLCLRERETRFKRHVSRSLRHSLRYVSRHETRAVTRASLRGTFWDPSTSVRRASCVSFVRGPSRRICTLRGDYQGRAAASCLLVGGLEAVLEREHVLLVVAEQHRDLPGVSD